MGLLGRRCLDPDEGLLIAPCSAVHTFFMRFPIDVAFLDRTGTVLKTASAVPPSRIVLGGPRACIALELPPGTLTRTGTGPGHRLALHAPAGAEDRAHRCRCARALMENTRWEGPHA